VSFFRKLFGISRPPERKTDVAILFDFECSSYSGSGEEAREFLQPVLEFMASRSDLPVNFKISGVSLSSLLSRGVKSVETIAGMISGGSAEFLGTGYSNSALPIFDDVVVLDQLSKQRDYVKMLFDCDPAGFYFPFSAVSRDVLSMVSRYGYGYIIFEDVYLNSVSAREISEAIDRDDEPGGSRLPKMMFVPQIFSCDGENLIAFSEFTAFMRYFLEAAMAGSRGRKNSILKRVFGHLAKLDSGSVVTLRFDSRAIITAFKAKGAGLSEAASGVISILEWLADSGYASASLYRNSLPQEPDRLHPVSSEGLVRYVSFACPALYDHFTASMEARRHLASLNKFYKKLGETQRLFSRLLKAESEKAAYNPIIELAREIGLIYQYSLGSVEESERSGTHLEKIPSAGIYLGFIREMRTKNKGVFVYDIDSDRAEEIVFINERIFLVLKSGSGIAHFINLPSGMESIPSDLDGGNRASDEYCGSDQYSVSSGEFFVPQYTYYPSQSLMVGAQFTFEAEQFRISKGLSLFNNALIIRYKIKNTRTSELNLAWKIVFRFAPDFLSVLKYGESVLGFFSGNSRLQTGIEHVPGESGVSILNRISGACVNLGFGRAVPMAVRSDLQDHSLRSVLDYSFVLAPLEECNFTVSVSFGAKPEIKS